MAEGIKRWTRSTVYGKTGIEREAAGAAAGYSLRSCLIARDRLVGGLLGGDALGDDAVDGLRPDLSSSTRACRQSPVSMS